MSNEIYIDKVLDEYVRGHLSIEETMNQLKQESVTDAGEVIAMHQQAVAALQRNAILAQVKRVHAQFVPVQESLAPATTGLQERKAGKTARMQSVKWVLRIAAMLIIMAGGWLAYEYNAASSSKLYAEMYQPYKLNTDRNLVTEIVPHNMLQEYKERDYKAVIRTFQSLAVTSNREKFLAASAYHETGNFSEAIELLNLVLAYNRTHSPRLYNDEAEFYIGLSYLKMNNNKAALPWFQKIYDDPAHTFHERVTKWALTRLKWLN